MRTFDHIALLSDAVQPLRFQHLRDREAIEKRSEARSEHGFGRFRPVRRAEPPRDARARREIAFVADVILNFVADAPTESEVRRARQSSCTNGPASTTATDARGFPAVTAY